MYNLMNKFDTEINIINKNYKYNSLTGEVFNKLYLEYNNVKILKNDSFYLKLHKKKEDSIINYKTFDIDNSYTYLQKVIELTKDKIKNKNNINILSMGLALGTYPLYISKIFKNVKNIDCVEYDKNVIFLFNQLFRNKKSETYTNLSNKLNIINLNIIDFIKNNNKIFDDNKIFTNKKYDVIFDDTLYLENIYDKNKNKNNKKLNKNTSNNKKYDVKGLYNMLKNNGILLIQLWNENTFNLIKGKFKLFNKISLIQTSTGLIIYCCK